MESTHAYLLHSVHGLGCGTVVQFVQRFGIHQQHIGITQQWPVDVATVILGTFLGLPVDTIFTHAHTSKSVHLILIAVAGKFQAIVADGNIAALVVLIEFEVECRHSHHLCASLAHPTSGVVLSAGRDAVSVARTGIGTVGTVTAEFEHRLLIVSLVG